MLGGLLWDAFISQLNPILQEERLVLHLVPDNRTLSFVVPSTSQTNRAFMMGHPSIPCPGGVWVGPGGGTIRIDYERPLNLFNFCSLSTLSWRGHGSQPRDAHSKVCGKGNKLAQKLREHQGAQKLWSNLRSAVSQSPVKYQFYLC